MSKENKPETIDQAADQWLMGGDWDSGRPFVSGFKLGANWQSKQMYSAEEVISALAQLQEACKSVCIVSDSELAFNAIESIDVHQFLIKKP